MMYLVTNRVRLSIIPITCYMQQNQESRIHHDRCGYRSHDNETSDKYSMTAVMAMSMTSRLLIALVRGINMVVVV